MGDQHSGEGSSSSDASVSNSDSMLELKIKTLDSRMFTFHVEKNIPVLSFKGKIADQIGVPVGQQRLIFRGKVLKDEHVLSEYHVENGDTLHLVERQPTQEQPSSGTGTGAVTSGNTGSQGNDASAGVPRSRIGQISHSVVLGSFNVGDPGEATGSELTRVIGAVLNSLGVGGQGMVNGAVGATNNSGPVPQRSNTEQQGHGRGGTPSHAHPPFGQPFLSQPFSVPLSGASFLQRSLIMPIPDSLNTLSEFISRMEGVLSQNGSEPPSSTTSSAAHPPPGLSSDARGLPTPEALSVVLRHAQRLLSDHVVAALSNIAGRLEQEGQSMDASVRSQIQSDSVQTGLAMQHLGALFLELGRTMLQLRMGNSPAEAVINSGPAVYISPSGPNPIMVQPFPHQISPLFNAPAASAPNSGSSIPIGIVGNTPRNVNIHIHAGASLPPIVAPIVARAAGGEGTLGERNESTASGDPAGARMFPLRSVIARAAGGEGTLGERNGSTASGDPAGARMFPLRSVIATTVPPRSATIAVTPVTSSSQPIGGGSTSQLPEHAAMVLEINSQIRSLLENMRAGNQTSSGRQENSVPDSSAVSGEVSGTIDPSNSIQSESSEEAREFGGFFPELQAQHGQPSIPSGSLKSNEESSGVGEPSASSLSRELPEHSESNVKAGEASNDSAKSTVVTEAPIGLGGGLQPKRRGQQSKIQLRRGEGGTSSSVDQSQAARASGQQVLQTLLSQSTHGRTNSNAPVGSGEALQGLGQGLENTQSGGQASGGQVDVNDMMSQLLDSPALNGLLSGVAQLTGAGSPNVLRNMLQQFTQNPAMRNTVNQLAQQLNTQDLGSMFGGGGGGAGQGGNLDFSSMFQQMMPVVSQVLGNISVETEQVDLLIPELPSQDNRDDRSFTPESQGLARQIENQASSEDIYRSLAQTAATIAGTSVDEYPGWLSNQELIAQFMETFHSDLRRQLQDDSA